MEVSFAFISRRNRSNQVFQTFLRETPVGLAFFGQVAQPQAVKNVLREACTGAAES